MKEGNIKKISIKGLESEKLKILMLGWEYPPFYTGGTGTVCKELCEALGHKDVEITYVMPHGPEDLPEKLKTDKFKLIITNRKYKNIRYEKTNTDFIAYMDSVSLKNSSNQEISTEHPKEPIYGKNLAQEVNKFTKAMVELTAEEEFDLIHAQDWVTFPAGIALKEKTKKPLIAHMHITEFNKTGMQHADPFVYTIEKKGMETADKVVAVSNRLKKIITEKYMIDEKKIDVIHHAPIPMNQNIYFDGKELKGKDKLVLFAGRLTLQKGPDWFIKAAEKVLEYEKNVKFVMAGKGDMMDELMNKVAEKGLGTKITFLGFFTREQADKLFSMADVYVCPSVEEPFCVIPHEAQMKKTPVVLSKQTGIAEVFQNSLKVDFWDVEKMASHIISLLRYPDLHTELNGNGYKEVTSITWGTPAQQCIELYNKLTGGTT